MKGHMINRTNPYSGQSIELNEDEDRLYCIIKNAEIDEQYDKMQKAIDKFSILNPKAYMVLLD